MGFERILHNHLKRYPYMQIQDVYKLIHQATMGSEHAVSNTNAVHKWMKRERSQMGNGPDEPMIESISADDQITRVHLRPFLAQGGNIENLLDGFIRTANEFHGDLQNLEDYWNITTKTQYFETLQMNEFIKSMKAKNYPAVHHSEKYGNLYLPAYRVVWRKFIL
jgi:hypothetical protein